MTNYVNEIHVYNCNNYRTECSTPEELESYVLELHNMENTLICNKYSNEFTDENDLRQHMTGVHENTNAHLGCDKCGQQFSCGIEIEGYIRKLMSAKPK